MRTIKVQIRESYGRKLIYPVNEDAHRFIKMLGRKTFTTEDLKLIQEMGFQIELEHLQLDLNLVAK